MKITDRDDKVKVINKAAEKAFKEGFMGLGVKDSNPYPLDPLVEDLNFLCHISYNAGCNSRGTLNGLITSHIDRLVH